MFDKINSGSCFHQFVVLVKNRDKFTNFLKKTRYRLVFIILIHYINLNLLKNIVLIKI